MIAAAVIYFRAPISRRDRGFERSLFSFYRVFVHPTLFVVLRFVVRSTYIIIGASWLRYSMFVFHRVTEEATRSWHENLQKTSSRRISNLIAAK